MCADRHPDRCGVSGEAERGSAHRCWSRSPFRAMDCPDVRLDSRAYGNQPRNACPVLERHNERTGLYVPGLLSRGAVHSGHSRGAPPFGWPGPSLPGPEGGGRAGTSTRRRPADEAPLHPQHADEHLLPYCQGSRKGPADNVGLLPLPAEQLRGRCGGRNDFLRAGAGAYEGIPRGGAGLLRGTGVRGIRHAGHVV